MESDTDVQPGPADAAGPGRAAGGRGRLRAAAAVTVAAAVVGGLVWAWEWRTHPDVLPGYGNGYNGTLAPGQTLYVGLTFPDPDEGEEITLEAAVPRVVARNDAGATVATRLCTLDPQELRSSGIGAIGSVDGEDFLRYCPDPAPVTEGTRLDLAAEPAQQLLLAVTPSRPGVVLVRGVDLTYSHGWRHGTQTIGPRLRVEAR